MTDASFTDDPDLVALFDDAQIWLDCWTAQLRAAFTALYGMPMERMFDIMAESLLVRGERRVVGQMAASRPSKLRHDLISTGVVKPPARETREQRFAREDRAMGMVA